MLIYNYKKEFLGIDEADLTLLGFESLTALKMEADDFADLFVKTPGHVHNFQHVNWIDFVTCADSAQSTKVIIHANSRNFRCILDIKTAYLNENPSSKAFLVYLSNIRELSNDENEDISSELLEKRPTQEIPAYIPAKEEAFEELIKELQPAQEKAVVQSTPEVDTDLDLDLPLELDFHDDMQEPEPLEDALQIDVQEPIQKEDDKTSTEVFDNGYTFNPQVASDELGLPVDLIEEFIEDFIAQAKEFQKELYNSLDEGDTGNIKILSHKLKGVAANLRIEDALETLTIVNTSDSIPEIKTNLDTLYKIISKLSGEKITLTKKVPVQEKDPSPIHEDKHSDELDIFALPEEKTTETLTSTQEAVNEPDIFALPQEEEKKKETPKPIEDKDVPPKIDLPELADDNFIDQEDFFSTSDDSFEDTLNNEEESDTKLVTPSYDIKNVASEVGLGEKDFLELFQDYLNEAHEIVFSIADAIENNNNILWQNKALQLKGMGDNMRINEFTNSLETLTQTQDIQVAKDSQQIIAQSLASLSKIKG